MFVRISPGNGDPLDFEFDFDYSHLTDEIEDLLKKVISEKTSIDPDKQNAVFLERSKGLKNIQKLTVPTGISPMYQKVHLNDTISEIFEKSVVYVARVGTWAANDPNIRENLTVMYEEITGNPGPGDFLKTLYGQLRKSRTVSASMLEQFPSIRNAITRRPKLRDFLTVPDDTSESPQVTATELRCYNEIFNDIKKGIRELNKKRQYDSSALHAMYFGSVFMKLPFLIDDHKSRNQVELAQDRPSILRMFVKERNRDDTFKFSPRADFALIDIRSGLPTLTCEVDSHLERRDETRMIMQGVVACRQWTSVLPQAIKSKNRVLGLFVQEKLFVDSYLFHCDENNNVEIVRDGHDLSDVNQALIFARILFNYRESQMEITAKCTKAKTNLLVELRSSSEVLPSLTRGKKSASKKSHPSPKDSGLETIHESATDSDVLSLCAGVESRLCPDDTVLQGTEYEHIAVVKMSEQSSKPLGFIKVANKHELDAFEAIRKSGSELLLNRVILPTKTVEVSGYTLIFLPYGGEPLENSWINKDGPLGYEVEIAWDLLVIVSHLHELRIAHLDVKPANILWDVATHSIRVIDFDSSEILDPNGSQKIKGLLGTSGYVAPEVELEELEYDPFLADAFSCGRVIQEVVTSGKLTKEKWFVRDVSEFLCSEDVDDRWSVNKAIDVWTALRKLGDKPEQATYGIADSNAPFDGTLSASAVCVH